MTAETLGRWTRLRGNLLRAGQWCAVSSLFFASVNKPGTSVAIVLSLVFSLLGSDLRRRWSTAITHPVARGFLVWWAVLMLSALHTWYLTSRVPLGGSFVWICLFPLVMASLLDTATWRRRALVAFALAVLLTLVISCGMAAGLLPQRALVAAQPYWVDTVFKEYTQQGLALLIYMSMAMAAALVVRSRRDRLLLLASVVVGAINIVFMLESRTSYVVLMVLAGFWTWRLLLRGRATWRSVLLVGTLGTVVLASILAIPAVRNRMVDSLVHETRLYVDDHDPTSMGIRLELWRKTIPMVESAPVFGHGLHQWAPLYKRSFEKSHDAAGFLMGHPHQEMLLILAEQGAAGLLVYLVLICALARYIRRLDAPERDIYACILIIYLVAGLANGLWVDFTHRNVFVLLMACIPLVKARTRPDTALAEPA